MVFENTWKDFHPPEPRKKIAIDGRTWNQGRPANSRSTKRRAVEHANRNILTHTKHIRQPDTVNIVSQPRVNAFTFYLTRLIYKSHRSLIKVII